VAEGSAGAGWMGMMRSMVEAVSGGAQAAAS
jgi:hypothetical protein